MVSRLIVLCTLTVLLAGAICMAESTHSIEIKQIDGQAELGSVEIHGVGSDDFRPSLWESGKLNFLPDVRSPLIQPRKSGVFRNIYAPAIVDLKDDWRVFYGAWDGVDSGNDRIYSVNTKDFLDFTDRKIVIEHGDFIHCCNVSATRLPNGEYRLMCTVYPDKDDLNKPALFSSPDGVTWNGSPTLYYAKQSDIVSMDGYDKYQAADINGMNVIMYDNGVYRLYFDNFKDYGKVYRATSQDGKHYRFDGTSLDFGCMVNDVKKLSFGGETYYLMGMHANTSKLWYSLSRDGMKFSPAVEFAKSQGDADKYMVAIGWVIRQNRVLGFLYGAGAVGSLDRNRIFARWLQKKVVFIADDGTRYEASGALGPDRQIITVPKDKEIKGRFEVYSEDGDTRLPGSVPATLMSGAVYVLSDAK